MKDIHDVIQMVDDWKGKKYDIEELTKGITNKNFKVTIEGKSYVVRIPGEGTDLFIDREVEYHNTLAVSEVGVGALIYEYFKPEYIAIAEFIDGEVMSVPSLKDKERIVKATRAIKRVNMRAKFISKFIMFDKFDEYLEIIKKHNIKVPENFGDAVVFVNRVRDKFLKTMPELAACHNDLLAENFIDQGDRMRIIDWELSGMNDACFELGDFSVEQELGEDEDVLMIETYFGNFDEKKFARMNLYKSMADILWTLWAAIQNHLSDLEFDFWEYGMNRFNRAMIALNSDNFSRWLQTV
jgi:thiamine kinase-like enzyme